MIFVISRFPFPGISQSFDVNYSTEIGFSIWISILFFDLKLMGNLNFPNVQFSHNKNANSSALFIKWKNLNILFEKYSNVGINQINYQINYENFLKCFTTNPILIRTMTDNGMNFLFQNSSQIKI